MNGGGKLFFSNFTSDSRGVAILFPSSLDYKINRCITHDDGRSILIETEINDSKFILVNIYAPVKNDTQGQLTFISSLRDLITPYIGETLIIGGDHNITLDPNLDKSGGARDMDLPARDKLLELIEEFDLLDIWRYKNKGAKAFTCISPDGTVKN